MGRSWPSPTLTVHRALVLYYAELGGPWPTPPDGTFPSPRSQWKLNDTGETPSSLPGLHEGDTFPGGQVSQSCR